MNERPTKTAPAKRRRTRLPREVREQQIQKASLRIFTEKGFQSSSVREIADAAGIAEGTLYKFYRSKKEISEAVICTWYAKMINQYEKDLNNIEDQYKKLRFAIAHNLQSLTEDIGIANLYLELRRDNYFKSSKLVEYNRRYINLMRSIIIDIQEQRKHIANKTRPSLIAEMIYSMVETKSELYRLGRAQIDCDKIVSDIYDLTLKVI